MRSSSLTQDTPIAPEKLQVARDYARAQLTKGAAAAAILGEVQKAYPSLTAQDLFPVTQKDNSIKMRDIGRSLMQGVTLENADEGAGVVAMARKDPMTVLRMLAGAASPSGMAAGMAGMTPEGASAYVASRDAVRSNDQQFQQQHGVVDFLARLAGAAVPTAASLMIPGMQPVAGETGLNLLRAGVQGAGMGALQGEGASVASSPEDILWDTAKGAGFGAGASLAGSAIGQGVAARMANKTGQTASQSLQNEATSVLPQVGERSLDHGGTIDPAVIARRQERLAPNTTVVADLSPSAQALLADIGADRVTATKALQEAAGRTRVLNKTYADVGKWYDGLLGHKVPLTNDVRIALSDAAKAVGRNKQLSLADVDIRTIAKQAVGDADAGDLHRIRSVLLRNARTAEKSNPGLARQLNDVADRLTTAIEPIAPNIRQIDAEYAFMGERAEAARATHDIIKSSLDRYAKQRIWNPPALKGDVTMVPTSGTRAGVTILKKGADALTGNSMEARAKAVYGFLLNPATTDETLARTQLLQILGQTLKGRAMPGVGMASGLAGSAVNDLRTQP